MKNRAFLVAAASMALSANAAHAAQATDAACMTEAEVEGVLLMLMPDVVREIAKACKPSLAADAYLTIKGEALVSKFAAESEATKSVALAGVTKLVGEDGKNLPPDEMAKLLKVVIGPKIGEELKAKDCSTIDRIFGYLDPMPARNLSGLLTVIVNVSTADSGKAKPAKRRRDAFPPICKSAGA